MLTYRLNHALTDKGMGIALPQLPQPGKTTRAVLDETDRAWLLLFALFVLSLTLAQARHAVPLAILFGTATAFGYGLLADFSDLLFGFWGSAALILLPLFLLLAWLLKRAVNGIGRWLAAQLLLFGILYPSVAGLGLSTAKSVSQPLRFCAAGQPSRGCWQNASTNLNRPTALWGQRTLHPKPLEPQNQHLTFSKIELMKRMIFCLLSLAAFISPVLQAADMDLSQFFQGKDGCFLLYDLKANKIVQRFNEKRCAQRFAPCSTFKMPLALMAFDQGILKDETTTYQWDGVDRLAHHRQERTGLVCRAPGGAQRGISGGCQLHRSRHSDERVSGADCRGNLQGDFNQAGIVLIPAKSNNAGVQEKPPVSTSSFNPELRGIAWPIDGRDSRCAVPNRVQRSKGIVQIGLPCAPRFHARTAR